MSANSATAAKPYRWVEIRHEDLDFYNVPRPLPWPRGADTRIPADGDFPFRTLVEGIRLLLADEGAPPNPIWRRLAEIVEAGEELAEAFEAADLDRAEKILDRLDDLHPGCPFVYFNKAFVVRQRGDKTEALHLYQAAVDAAPNLEFLWMRLGEVAEELGKNRLAISAYRKAQSLLAPHPQALEGLARLGAMKRVEHLDEAGEREIVYVTAKEFERIIHAELAALDHDRARLRALLDQLLAGNDGRLAVAAAEKLLALTPNDFEAQRALAEAWRLAGNAEQAEACLQPCLAREPHDAWCHYLLAWVRFDQKDPAAGWALIDRALALDPNLQPAIVAKFGLHPGQNDPRREERVAAWAAENKSYQGFLLCSIQARDRGDARAALGYARQAYELAPDHQIVLLQYTGLLGQTGEKEWMAALTKRMLTAGKGDYQVKYQFANALHDLGLNEEAVNVLRRVLAEETGVPLEWREAIGARIEQWSGLVAASEVPLELIGEGILRRPVVLVLDREETRELVPAGAPLPQRKVIQLNLRQSVTSIALAFEQGYARGTLGPVRLGYFFVEGIEPGAAVHPDIRLTVTEEGTLQVGARQGERRLPVKWSLYPEPAAEAA
jgi:tetratricopeptide (TPR) repeat protein